MKTLEWNVEKLELRLIDQRLLPGQFEIFICSSYQAVAQAIREMVVRGAPAIGATAAFGIALAACRSKATSIHELKIELGQASELLLASRPTAVNLSWGVQRMMRAANEPGLSISDISSRLISEAIKISDEDIETNKRIAANGAVLIQDGDTIIHHCNTGALATVDWGTALGVIRMAHESGKHIHVLVDETRPRLQGARLTAWELEQYHIPYEIICDNAAGYFLRTGKAHKVFFGADRVAANGDVANKIGSYMLALAAHANDVPVFSVFPSTTVDLELAHGDLIPIEERDASEVLNIQINQAQVAPKGARAKNPAFDVTPYHLFSALVTEKGVIYPPFIQNLPRKILEK